MVEVKYDSMCEGATPMRFMGSTRLGCGESLRGGGGFSLDL
jgi:hypothetical protein